MILYRTDIIFLFTLFNSIPTTGPFFSWQQVHYHSGGLRLNPNLYADGKVCLSLLNTWSGSKNQKWTPGVSTMLQVLVSIQGLILNAKPYFNEPGWAPSKGKPGGEANSLQYNENTFILSLKTMLYTIRKPPKVWFYSWFISFISLLSLLCWVILVALSFFFII